MLKYKPDTFVFGFRDLQVYTGVTHPDKFYWRNVKHPTGFGPFDNQNDAMQHYETTLQEDTLPPLNGHLALVDPTIQNVLSVNFVTRKRV